MESLDSKIVPDHINSEDEEDEFSYNAQQRSSKLKKMLLSPEPMSQRSDTQIEELCLLLAADYQIFAKLREKDKDLTSLVKTLSMESYDSNSRILQPGDTNIQYVYIVIDGFLSVYTKPSPSSLPLSDFNSYKDEDNVEWQRIDSLIAKDVFGELYLLYDIPCQVLIRTEGRSNLIKIPKEAFEEYIKEYYLESMENMIEFYRELLFGDKIELKHLLPLAGVTQMRKVQANVVLVKQGEKAKYIYFIKSGITKVMREVPFIKEVDEYSKHEAESFYKDPTYEDYNCHNVKNRLLEVDKLGRFCSFGDRDFPPPKYTE